MMKLGARDYLVKDTHFLENLPLVVARVFKEVATERELADVQRKLRESEGRFRRLAENAQDLIYRYELTPKRGFTYVSPVATFITGFTPNEHYADPDLGIKLVHPDDRPILEAATRGEIPPNQLLTLRWVRKDNIVIWTEQRNKPVFDEEGNPLAIEGMVRDITEKKRAEETLRESEASLKFSQQVAHVGHCTWDTSTNRVMWSEEMYRIFGLDHATNDGNLDAIIEKAIYPDDREKVKQSNTTVLTEQKPTPLKNRVIWPDGTAQVIRAQSGIHFEPSMVNAFLKLNVD